MNNIFDTLFNVLEERKANPKPGSYTNSLLDAGEDEIVKKIGEEAVELIIAAKSQGNQRVVEETADLLYHTLVLLVSRDLTLDDIKKELENRHQ